jgi:N-acetylneuraminic acid mutarotase
MSNSEHGGSSVHTGSVQDVPCRLLRVTRFAHHGGCMDLASPVKPARARWHPLFVGLAVGLALSGCDDQQQSPVEPGTSATSVSATAAIDPSDKSGNAVDQGAPSSPQGSVASLSVAAVAGNVTAIPFAPQPGPFANQVAECDDCLYQSLPVGFNFVFFGNTYSTFNLSTNGFISFGPGSDNGCCSGRTIPLNDEYNNIIAAAWTDLYSPGGGGIFYETRGPAPHRTLVVAYENLPWYDEYGVNRVTTQIILYEGTNNVEIHTTNQSVGHTYTQGVEDASGTTAVFVPGRVAANYGFENDAVRFTGLSTAWTSRAGLPSARRAFAMAATNGALYAIGGSNSSNVGLTTVQAYSPGSNSWVTKAALPAARQTGNGAVAINGIIYLPGGHDASNALTKTLYAYNPSTNSWSTKSPLPVFSSCGGSAVIGGKIYLFSGCTRSSTGAQVPAAFLHRYNPATNTWTALHPGPSSHFQPFVGAIAGKLYVVGGNNASNIASGRLDVYDPATNSWTTRAPMPTARAGAAGSAIGGKLVVIGGRNGATYLSVVEAYDPVANSWTPGSSMPTARAALGVGGLSGFLYAIGGRNSASVLAANERFTP